MDANPSHLTSARVHDDLHAAHLYQLCALLSDFYSLRVNDSTLVVALTSATACYSVASRRAALTHATPRQTKTATHSRSQLRPVHDRCHDSDHSSRLWLQLRQERAEKLWKMTTMTTAGCFADGRRVRCHSTSLTGRLKMQQISLSYLMTCTYRCGVPLQLLPVPQPLIQPADCRCQSLQRSAAPDMTRPRYSLRDVGSLTAAGDR